jgi:fructose-1,6-bisphosphatase I
MSQKHHKTITLNRFLVERQKDFPGSSGRFTRFMGQIGTAGKIIANYLHRAILEGLTGYDGTVNVQGEKQEKLDRLGNEVFIEAFEYVDLVGMLVSEEMSEPRRLVPKGNSYGYALMIDPIDGSSNLDVNGVVGTIFSVHRLTGEVEDSLLQKGRDQIAAGYLMYGPATLLVYTSGSGVHSFVLDREIGEFVLDQADIRIPEKGSVFAADLGNYGLWPAPAQAFCDHFTKGGAYSLRYSGALLADLHNLLSRGGVYFYPESKEQPDGKLRLLYECNPLAMVIEQAGGAASSGRGHILDIDPREIHQRTPIALGSKHEVALFEEFHRQAAAK